MNAYELANALDWVCENHLIGIGDADFKTTATMLREQGDRIAVLEQQRDAYKEAHDALLAHNLHKGKLEP